MNQELKTVNLMDVIKKLDPKSDEYVVLEGMTYALAMLGQRSTFWKTVAFVAIVGNLVQLIASLYIGR